MRRIDSRWKRKRILEKETVVIWGVGGDRIASFISGFLSPNSEGNRNCEVVGEVEPSVKCGKP